MTTVTKGLINRGDFAGYDGVDATVSRVDSTGGTITGLPVGVVVDVLQAYGTDATDRTSSAIVRAIARIGSAEARLLISPGSWNISSNLTIPANLSVEFPHGATFSIQSSKTVTINGKVHSGPHQIFTGAGTAVCGAGNRFVLTEWWGYNDSNSAATNTTAWHSARDSVSTIGGGIIKLLQKTYTIKEYTYGSSSRVTIEGPIQVITSGTVGGARILCTSGVWAVRMPQTCISPGLRNVSVQSNGVVAAPNVTPGTEYGVLVEQRNVTIENVTISGFQHGLNIGGYGFSSTYRNLSIVGNTFSGFSVTAPDNTSRGYQHPNLAAESPALDNTTLYCLDNCTIRSNAWGMILRAGVGILNNCTLENNLYAGIIAWQGTSDPGCAIGSTGILWMEANFGAFAATSYSTNWNSVAVTGNKLLLNSAGVPITLVDNATNALSDFGYQIILGAYTTGSGVGPARCYFEDIQGSLQGNAKVLLAKQCYRIGIDKVSFTSGDTANYYRSGGAGGYAANYVHVMDPYNGAWPATFGNRAFLVSVDTSGPGGLIASKGYFQSEGDVSGNYETTLTGVTSPSPTTGTVFYRRVSNVVTLDIPAMSGTSNSTDKTLTGMPSAIFPTHAKSGFPVVAKDNAGTKVWGYASVGTDGVVTLYPNATGGAWTNSGACSIDAFSITYNVE